MSDKQHDHALGNIIAPRVNLIFNGLMAFRDAGPQHYDVYIPYSDCHLAKYGNPRDCKVSDKTPDYTKCLKDFPPNPPEGPRVPMYYTVEGVKDAGSQCAKPSAVHAVV